MEEKQLKRLSRQELISLLIDAYEENEALKEKLAQAEEELQCRHLAFENAGSLADAAIGLSQVLEAAQKAADLYTESVVHKYKDMDKLVAGREAEAEAKAQEIIAEAEKRAKDIEKAARDRVEKFLRDTVSHFRASFDSEAGPAAKNGGEK